MNCISYSQNLEDVILWRALKHIEHGFYVDVGANDPTFLSVTRVFYEHGWRGINIDPVTWARLNKERTRDINLEVAAGATEEKITFYEVSDTALSTSNSELAEQYRERGHIVIERKVKSMTLNHILEKYSSGPIHFMNIDVEGAELDVLQGLTLSIWRPWIILVEATIPATEIPAFEESESLIVSSNYEFVYFDGLNRFYVAKEHGELLPSFRLPPNIFDHYVLSRQMDDQRDLEAKEKVIEAQNRELKTREEIIQRFQTSYLFWISDGPFRWVPGVRLITSRLQSFHRMFMPKVGVLEQYPAHPLFIPKKYLTACEALAGKLLPSVSIVTPSYNQGEFIERTIQSVLDQKYPHLEYIVQDGNSNDGTLDVLKSFQQKLTYVDSRQDNGFAQAINLGLQRTSGEIMAYLNSDDILLPGTLRYVADYFTRHPEVDVIYSHRVIVNEQDQEIGRWVLPPHDHHILLWADYVPQETLFWRRSIWERIGGYVNESFHFAVDWDLLIRFQVVGAKFKRLPRFLAAFRLHPKQKTSMQMGSFGVDEMNRLRRQVHGREISWKEVKKNIAPYLWRSIVYDKLYRLGVVHY